LSSAVRRSDAGGYGLGVVMDWLFAVCCIEYDETDLHAWNQFVDRYGCRICERCRIRRLQPADE
ncbi:MAG: hypothetical protein R3C59_31420, partial [Planctomycetaceae bacterium]